MEQQVPLELVVRDPVTGAVIGSLSEMIARSKDENAVIVSGNRFDLGAYQGFKVETDAETGQLNISVTYKPDPNGEPQDTIAALHSLAIEGKLRALREARTAAASARMSEHLQQTHGDGC